MKTFKARLAAARKRAAVNLTFAFRNQSGAFDLPSILVGVVVVGVLTVGVLAMIFGVIPFSQDKSAQQNLGSIATAEGSYYSQATSFGQPTNTYTTMSALAATGVDLLADDLAAANPDTATTANKINLKAGKAHWYAVTRSESGKFFSVSDMKPVPQTVAGADIVAAMTTAATNYGLTTQANLDTP